MANTNHTPEAPKKVSAKESVESLIDRKKAEKEAEVTKGVTEKVGVTKEEVKEVMVGAEKPKEKVSKRAGEKGEGAMPTGAAAAGDEAAVIAAQLKDYDFPSEEIMVKKIRSAINAQIKTEWKNALKFRKNLNSGGANGYNCAIAKIRELKQVLTSLFEATFGFLKNLYVKYFTPDGKRRKVGEV
jgi:hypothetical protein